MQQQKFELSAAAGGARDQFWFSAVDPFYGLAVAREAVSVFNWLTSRHPNTAQIAQALEQFDDRCEKTALDQSIRAVITEAGHRGIPWFRLGPGLRDVQFGQGRYQRRMRETLTSQESLLAATYSRDKALTLGLLSSVGLPVGMCAAVSGPDQAVTVAKTIGFPVVIKPTVGQKGTGVIIGLTTPDAVHQAAKSLLRGGDLLVQSFLPGQDHRLLVVSGRFVAGARRDPAAVVGDGKRTIERLIEIANADPRRGKGFSKLMNNIVIDDELRRVLTEQGYALDSVPDQSRVVRLRLTANIATGGTAVDVTDSIHPDNVRLAERAALALGLNVAGVDFITPDINKSWREVGGGICEVNASVGLRPHWLANPLQDVVGAILNTIFPPGKDGRIPTALVTGSNGKTTTTRMLAHILRSAGHVVGAATTDGVLIDDEIIAEGDLAGPTGASLVLREPTVSAAVLETARGGVIKSGIYLDRCDVAALLNVDREQIEIDGIQTLDDMARLKKKVVETAREAVIVNAEDRRCMEIAHEFPIAQTVLFAVNPSIPAIREHVADGGTVVTLREDGGKANVVIRTAAGDIQLLEVAKIPATHGGIVRHNVANALAAAALAYGMKVQNDTIATGLSTFRASIEQCPGRFNLIDSLPAHVLFDYAHNPPALESAVTAIDLLSCSGRRICAFTSAGNRTNHQIEACADSVAGHFDHYVCFERAELRRGRAPCEINELLVGALIKGGVDRNSDCVISNATGGNDRRRRFDCAR